jgi:bla regulator protein blaR1
MTSRFIINHLWQSSCFVLLAGLLAFVLRKNSPKVRYWIWLSASLKFLVPLTLLVSLGSVLPRPAPQAASIPAPVFQSALFQLAEPLSPASPFTVSTHAPIPWVPVAIGIAWALGFAAIALVRYHSWSRIRASLRASTPVELPISVPAFIVPGAEEPGIVGFLRPVLVLPGRLLEHLNPRQLAAVLTHELCHVRRRDNLFAAAHMVVEAIFWFHPVVWWIGSRMVEERELACDEEVLRMGCEPTDYVEGILKVCRFYTESPLPCVSGVTGADVKKRLRAILAGSLARELSLGRKVVLATVGLATVAVPIIIGVLNAPRAWAQTGAQVEFDVASVKPNNSGCCASFGFSQRGTVDKNVTLKKLIALAYRLQDFEVYGGPRWVDADHFDVEGKTEDPKAGPDQARLMLQSLLAERFRLKLHRETRQLPVYALVVDKGGPKIKLSADQISPTVDGPSEPGAGPNHGAFRFGAGSMTGNAVGLSSFTRLLSQRLDRRVIDRTGLEGRFDIQLQWTPGPGESPFDPGGNPVPAPTDFSGPSIFTAIQEQLGLKLESGKGPVEVLMIDHVEKPSEN